MAYIVPQVNRSTEREGISLLDLNEIELAEDLLSLRCRCHPINTNVVGLNPVEPINTHSAVQVPSQTGTDIRPTETFVHTEESELESSPAEDNLDLQSLRSLRIDKSARQVITHSESSIQPPTRRQGN